MKYIYFEWNEKIITKIVKNLSYIYLRYNFIIYNFWEIFLVFSIISIYRYISVVHFLLLFFLFSSLVKFLSFFFFYDSTTQNYKVSIYVYYRYQNSVTFKLTAFCWSFYQKHVNFRCFDLSFVLITNLSPKLCWWQSFVDNFTKNIKIFVDFDLSFVAIGT